MILRTSHLVLEILLLSIFHGAVSTLEVFEIKPKSVDVDQGRKAILRCSLKDQYAQSFVLSWLHDGREIQGGRRHVDDGNLVFTTVDKNLDAGRFQCIATNKTNPADEYITDPVELYIKWVKPGPVLLRSPASNKDILPRVRVMLKCNFTANPKLRAEEIHWTRNNIDIKDQRFPELGDIQLKKDRLIIPEAALDVYDGEYACCARNECSQPNYTLHVRDISVPVLVTPPADAVVLPGGTARFFCGFEATPPPTIRWTDEDDFAIPIKQDKQDLSDDCRMCSFANGTLVIKRVKEKYTGIYTCVATGKKGNVTSSQANLQIASISKFPDTEPEVEYISVGRNVEKVCSPPDAVPRAAITWTKNGVQIERSSGFNSPRVTVSGNTLVITEAQVGDKGDYQCVASNMAGNTTRTFRFLIATKPTMRSRLVDRTENEGADVSLKCDVDGNPPVTYTWYQNLTAIKPDGKRFAQKDNELIIFSISTQFAATYKCIARNSLGEAQSEAVVRVSEQLKLVPEPQDTCIEAGKKAEIICASRGVRNPTASWTGLDQADDGKPDAYEIVANGPGKNNQSLIFEHPKYGDSWRFVCTANGEAGISPKTKTITITVGNKPIAEAVPQKPTIYEGQAVRLDCGIVINQKTFDAKKVRWTVSASGSPPKVYTFIENGEGDKYTILMINGSFYIKQAMLADTGQYTCSYSDCGFEVQSNITLLVVENTGPLTTSLGPGGGGRDKGTPEYQKIQTVALAVGSSVAYLILTVTIIVYCRRKKRAKKSKNDSGDGDEDVASDDEEKAMLNGATKTENGVSKKTNMLMVPITHLDDDIENLQYDHAKLVKVTVIGHGDFGEVFLSKAPGLLPDLAEDVLVMVKELDPGFEEKEGNFSSNNANGHISDHSASQQMTHSRRYEFNREIRLLQLANHENVVRLLGVCSKHTASPTKPDHLITEYLEWGILKLCLQASREGKIKKFGKNLKMRMCCQIAAGLEHLTKLGVAHRDVATRNCVLSSKMLIKLTVLSLTKEGFESDYCMYKGRRQPIRWIAPEALFQDTYTLKSDVWSFGVTCWEIFMLGETPYSDLGDEQFLDGLQSSSPPTLPPLSSSKRITSLISKCCHRTPDSRPEFYQIVKKLQSIVSIEAKSTTTTTATVSAPKDTDTGSLIAAATEPDEESGYDRVEEVA